MFNWFRRWRQNRGRAIFRYWDGQKFRCADPITLWRAIKAHPRFNLENHPVMHDAGDDEATLICLEATRDIFGVKPVEAGGLTEIQTLDLLGSYFDWVHEVKKNISSSVTLSAPTPASGPFCGMEVTNSSAEPSSTCAAPSSAAPTP